MNELRQYERVGFLCKLELSEMPGGAPQAARSVDLSFGGVGFVTQSPFSVGQLVTVTFYFKDVSQNEVRDQVVGRIVHFAADVDANRVGVEFLCPLAEAEHPLLAGKLLSQ